MPTAKDCNTPAPSAGSDECISASDAVKPLVDSFHKYSVSTGGEQAALLSWMAFESNELKYNINHFPGTPGQGTRCMLSPSFVSKYVAALPELKGKTASDPASTLKLVLDPEHSLGSAAWFYSSQCDDSVKTGLQQGSDQAFQDFMTKCVSTTMVDKRMQYWNAAKKALSVQ
ncbi:MAG: hypothetical protein Q9227_007106 [Pyrenula ochraceoflavens]